MLAEETTYVSQLAYGERPKVLIVEDDEDVALMLQDHLDYSLSAEVTIASSADQAIQRDLEDPADVVLIDYLLPDCDGAKLIGLLNSDQPGRPAILITGQPTLGRAISGMRCGAVDMFVKPFDLDSLTQSVAAAIERHRAQQQRVRRLQKVRQLARGVIKERRQLRKKLDLVCRDLVKAYHDLAVKLSGLKGNHLET